ncbi:TMV resistance protein N-like [Hevea brasiliensis]|uniref:TMV resistance protein N-like n=1 Tax=Hevea brasiliensis TaxID=3981 RepID=UPI0025D22005|nr:TMV resistance protein N-like [Hevea brasiliensis]
MLYGRLKTRSLMNKFSFFFIWFCVQKFGGSYRLFLALDLLTHLFGLEVFTIMSASKAVATSSSCSDDEFSSFRGKTILSCRGKDVLKPFADHLYVALTQAGIHTFRDDDEIERGENIEQELKKAIQQSKVAVIVFSPDYASSRWRLNELLKINEVRKSGVMHILAIFYHVHPHAVRWQTGSFTEAVVRHEEQLKVEIDKVERWRAALKEVADLGGEVLKDQ